MLVVGYAGDGDTLYVNDPGFERSTYSFAADVVGWRLYNVSAPAPVENPLEKYKHGLVPWRWDIDPVLYTDDAQRRAEGLKMAQAQATAKITQAMVDEALAYGSC